MRPTMMDVAARAGVSQATVSLVLNGSPGARFSEDTRRKVHEAAQELGYQLARREQATRAVTANVIAFVTDEISTDPWMALAFEGVRDKALEFGISTMLTMSRSGEDGAEDLLSDMDPQALLGIIYGTILTRQISPLNVPNDIPAVLLNCYDDQRKLPSVLPGDLAGGRAATERLIQAGHRRIAYINGQDGIDASRDRLRGYRQALASNDIAFDPELVRPGNWEPPAGYNMTMELMALESPPDAIFCANDIMAGGCYEALKELGKRIPEDVAVVGFDNREIAQFMRPPLTTVVLPQYEMGYLAAELLIDSAGGLQTRHDQLKVECNLVERCSVRAAP